MAIAIREYGFAYFVAGSMSTEKVVATAGMPVDGISAK
jgi:hypothetical protein